MKKLKVYRIARKLTQSELSEIADVNFRMIQQYESGERNINHARAINVYKLARALDLPMERLLEDERER